MRRGYRERIANAPPCDTADCPNNIARPSYGLCEACYMRFRRNGTVDSIVKKQHRKVLASGYVWVHAPGHPVARADGSAFEHRVVLYDRIGPGPHPCVWCSRELEWSEIKVDHLNEVKDDNTPDNLVPACGRCNEARGAVVPFLKTLTLDGWVRFVEVSRQHLSVEACKSCHSIITGREKGK